MVIVHSYVKLPEGKQAFPMVVFDAATSVHGNEKSATWKELNSCSIQLERASWGNPVTVTVIIGKKYEPIMFQFSYVFLTV